MRVSCEAGEAVDQHGYSLVADGLFESLELLGVEFLELLNQSQVLGVELFLEFLLLLLEHLEYLDLLLDLFQIPLLRVIHFKYNTLYS